jgi:hypothetical protein
MFVSVYKRLAYGSSPSFSYLGIKYRQAIKRIESLLNGRFGCLFVIKPFNFSKMNSYFFINPKNLRGAKFIKEVSYIGNRRYASI